MSDTAKPLPQKHSLSLPVKEMRALNAHTFLMTLRLNPTIAESCLPGQFFNLRPLKSTVPLLRRPISICETRPEMGEIDFLVQRIGEGSGLLVKHLPGEQVEAIGPLGNPFTPDLSKPSVMIAGGVGVAPLYFLSRWMRRNAPNGVVPPITFCYGVRAEAGFVLLDRIKPVVSELVVTTEDGSAGGKGFITSAIGSYLTEEKRIFACGPSPMMNAVLKMLRERGLEAQFSLENRMGCGLGACQGCVVPGRKGMIRVCCDGPVVSSEAIEQVFAE